MSEQRYGRGQVEWALDELARYKPRWGTAGDANLLKMRIKRLLDADRTGVLPEEVEAKAAPYAFNEAAPTGKGGEASFTAFDIYCLWTGLRLLHLGFKQSEVAAAVRLVRPQIKKAYRSVLKRAPDHEIRFGVTAPKSPDYRAFLWLRGVDLVELIRSGAVGHGAGAFGKFAWVFDDFDALVAFQAGELLNDQEAIVLEIGGAALSLRRALARVPDIKRGRPLADSE
jgi:hypothetical protein